MTGMYRWQMQLADLYTLANDILENLMQQRHGYKSRFYYAFNPQLRFLLGGSSEVEQTKLLRQLADKGMLELEEKEVPADLPDDFISRNALKDKSAKTFYLKIEPTKFGEECEKLDAYKPIKQAEAAEDHLKVYVVMSDNRLIMKSSPPTSSYLIANCTMGRAPHTIFSYLVNQAPGRTVTRTILEVEAKITITRRLDQMVNKSIKSKVAREVFFSERGPNALKVSTPQVIGRGKFGLLAAENEEILE